MTDRTTDADRRRIVDEGEHRESDEDDNWETEESDEWEIEDEDEREIDEDDERRELDEPGEIDGVRPDERAADVDRGGRLGLPADRLPDLDAEPPACCGPLADVFDLLGRKYAMETICVIVTHGTARFRDLQSHVPDASTTTISTRLDELAEAGLVTRTQYDEVPPRVEYELTEEGAELGRRLLPVFDWARERGDVE